MGMYKQIRDLWKKPKANLSDLWRQRLIKWRKENSTTRIEKPTRIDRARSLGYKAKPGFIIVRQRIKRGGSMRPNTMAGRRSKHSRRRMVLAKSYQRIAEEHADKKYPNCEVLNSYWVAKDGIYYWYEVILVDKSHPSSLADKNINWIKNRQHKARAYRGLTSAGRKSRGLRNKGIGAEKIRPSLRAKKRQGTN